MLDTVAMIQVNTASAYELKMCKQSGVYSLPCPRPAGANVNLFINASGGDLNLTIKPETAIIVHQNFFQLASVTELPQQFHRHICIPP